MFARRRLTKRVVAEGGTSLMRLEKNIWKVVDLSIFLEDPDDLMGVDDLSKVLLANLRNFFLLRPLICSRNRDFRNAKICAFDEENS